MEFCTADTTDPFATAGEAVACAFETKQSAVLVRAVLRGERLARDLPVVGINPADPMASMARLAGLPVSSTDLAQGILNLKGNAAALSDWAAFVLRAAELFEYASSDLQGCERLMNYVWQIAYGNGLSPRAITLATMLRNWPSRRAG